MPQCQFLFSVVFWFQKSCSANILGIRRNKSQTSYFSEGHTEPEGQARGRPTASSPWVGAAKRGAAPPYGVGPSVTPSRRPFAYIFLPMRKPWRDRSYSRRTPGAPPPSKPSFGGQKFLLRHPAGTGIDPRSLLHRRHRLHHAP